MRWIMQSFENADFTVVVNSESAYQQFKSGTRLYSQHDSPLADLFYPAINMIHHNVCLYSNYGKLINICFEYTNTHRFIREICAGAQYNLPKHFKDFLCQVHQIQMQTTAMETVGLAFVEDITVLPEGEDLVRYVKEASRYERENPLWFQKDYRVPAIEHEESLTAGGKSLQDMVATENCISATFNQGNTQSGDSETNDR